MITRRKDYSKKEPSRDSLKVYVVCEGTETEPNYFGFFEGLSSNLQIIILPPDRVWFVIDTDSWEREGKIDVLRRASVRKRILI